MRESEFPGVEAQQNPGQIITSRKEADDVHREHHMNILLRVEKRIHRAEQQGEISTADRLEFKQQKSGETIMLCVMDFPVIIFPQHLLEAQN